MTEKDNVIRVAFGAPTEEVPSEEPLSNPKALLFEELIDTGVVGIYLVPEAEGVDLPRTLQGAPIVKLNFSYLYAPDDVFYNNVMVSQTLSFSGTFHECKIPWEAVVAFQFGENIYALGE